VRLLQHNARWAAKLEKQKARKEAAAARRRTQEAAAKAREEEEAARKKVNPFSAGAGAAGTGLGGMLFGAPAPAAAAPQETTVVADAEQDDSESESDEEESRLAEELAVKASLEATQRTADWAAAAAHYAPAQYLNTVPEPSSSARRAASAKLTPAAKAALKAGDGTVPNDDAGLKEWEGESYQRMMVSGVDEAFERFVARVGSEGRQVVRYELGGVPLPFCGSGIVYDKLWPQASRNATPVSRQAMAASDKNGRTYTPSAVPPCEACGGPRTFEVQLMPNLVNLLRPTSIAGAADEAVVLDSNASAEERRRREIESALGRKLPSQPDADGITRAKPQNEQQRLAEEAALRARTGLAWSTALVYTCEQDCCLPREAAAEGEAWREEWVGAQWEE
jgi:pre-rRNA-processing protein TSR4